MSDAHSPESCDRHAKMLICILRPPGRGISMPFPPGHGVPRLPPGRKPSGPPPGPPPPQVLQMYGRKVGFALENILKRREEERYSPEGG